MNFTKGITLCFFVVAGFCMNLVYAQESPATMIERVKEIQVSPEQVVNDMRDKLGINDDQAAQILPVIKAQVDKMKEVTRGISSNSIDPTDALRDMQEMMNKTQNDLSQILTPEQMAKWQELMSQGQAKANQIMRQ